MDTYNKVTLTALAVIILSLLTMSIPGARAQEVYHIKDMRMTLSWGDTNDSMTGSTIPITWDGSLTLSGGTIKVIHQLRFQDAHDRLLSTEGESIAFQSDITSDYDGLQLRLFPGNEINTPMLHFDSKATGRVSFSLKELSQKRTILHTLPDGAHILLELGAVSIDKGSLSTQVQDLIAAEKALCMQQISTQSACLDTVALKAKELAYQSIIKKLAAFNFEASAAELDHASKLHSDYLNFLGRQKLSSMSKNDFAKHDFSTLTFLSEELYNALQKTAPELLNAVPASLTSTLQILRAELDFSLIQQQNLTAAQYEKLSQVLRSFSLEERRILFPIMQTLTPAQWELLKPLSVENLSYAARFLLNSVETTRETQLKLYVEQLSKVGQLLDTMNQVQSSFSTQDSYLIKEMLFHLQKIRIDDNAVTPSLFKQFEDFFARSGVLTKNERDSALKVLMLAYKEVLRQSIETKIQEGALAFRDTGEDEWFYHYVTQAVRKSIVSGYKDAKGTPLYSYMPGKNVSVAELLKMVLETTTIGSANGTPMHTLPKGHWAGGYIKQAELLKLSVLSKAQVDIDRPATRAEVIRTLFEAYGYLPQEPTTFHFTDVTKDTPGANYIYFAYNLGIISGDDNTNTFRPYDPINRAEVAKIMILFLTNFKTPLDNTSIGGDLSL